PRSPGYARAPPAGACCSPPWWCRCGRASWDRRREGGAMSPGVQLAAIVVSAALLAIVLELVRRRVLTEEYSFLWIVFSLALLGLSIWRNILHAMARWLGIFYPP